MYLNEFLRYYPHGMNSIICLPIPRSNSPFYLQHNQKIVNCKEKI